VRQRPSLPGLRGYKTLGRGGGSTVEQDERALGEERTRGALASGGPAGCLTTLARTRAKGGGQLAMATRPGPLTEWPWQRLGNFKVRT
jgi:hypothetical protein